MKRGSSGRTHFPAHPVYQAVPEIRQDLRFRCTGLLEAAASPADSGRRPGGWHTRPCRRTSRRSALKRGGTRTVTLWVVTCLLAFVQVMVIVYGPVPLPLRSARSSTCWLSSTCH